MRPARHGAQGGILQLFSWETPDGERVHGENTTQNVRPGRVAARRTCDDLEARSRAYSPLGVENRTSNDSGGATVANRSPTGYRPGMVEALPPPAPPGKTGQARPQPAIANPFFRAEPLSDHVFETVQDDRRTGFARIPPSGFHEPAEPGRLMELQTTVHNPGHTHGGTRRTSGLAPAMGELQNRRNLRSSAALRGQP